MSWGGGSNFPYPSKIVYSQSANRITKPKLVFTTYLQVC